MTFSMKRFSLFEVGGRFSRCQLPLFRDSACMRIEKHGSGRVGQRIESPDEQMKTKASDDREYKVKYTANIRYLF